MAQAIVETKGLKKYFPIRHGLFRDRVLAWVRAVDGVDIRIGIGETFGLVGESGCGKTTVAKLIMLMEQPTAGAVLFKGLDISSNNNPGLAEYRRSVQVVNQDPTSSMNPRMRVRDIVGEPLTVRDQSIDGKVIHERMARALEQVKLPKHCGNLYPHEFSGGQRQRIAIARALVSQPECIVLDEPVSALDVSIRAQIINLLMDLQEKNGHSYLLIAHDLAVVKYMCKYVGVMYLGRIVELAESAEFYAHPMHPYTQALLSAVLPCHPDIEWGGGKLSGEVPSPVNPPAGCRFHPRCPSSRPQCSESHPDLMRVATNHWVACFPQ